MKIHRFYIGSQNPVEIQHFGAGKAWLQDKKLKHQWLNVLRLQVQEVVGLFDDEQEVLYKITEIKPDEIALEKVTEAVRKIPDKDVLVAWSLLKKDNNDLVLQKCTELGANKFIPLLAERSEKTGFDNERAKKIVIEASEQCGRGDIPFVHEPMTVNDFVNSFKSSFKLFVADGLNESPNEFTYPSGVLIGPEGGWSDSENSFFNDENISRIHLGNFVLRAETAAVVALSKLIQ